MARTIRFVVAGFFLSSVALLHAEQRSNPGAVEITLGRSAVPLYGPWKFTIGDSPMDPQSGKPSWAEQDFDDSKWETVDLTPKEVGLDPTTGSSAYVPGWTARGHSGYWGYAWYRIRVRVNAVGLQGLPLERPANADDGYQVFSNGAVIGSFGDFTRPRPVVYSTQPARFQLPPLGTDSTQVIAIRFWMDPSTLLLGDDVGGMHAAPVLGGKSAVALHYEFSWGELIRTYVSTSIETVLLGLFSVVIFSLIFFDRSDSAYLWMGALFLTTAAYRGGGVVAGWTTVASLNTTNLIVNDILFPISCGLCIMVWWVWFGRRGPQWIPELTAGLTVLLAISKALADEVSFGIISHHAALRFNTLGTVTSIMLFAILVRIAVDGIRHRGLDGWLFTPVLFLIGVTWFWIEIIALFHVQLYYYPYGVWVSPGLISRLLEAILISFLLLRRLLLSVKQQKEVALDVEQAQQLQQRVLVPDVIDSRFYSVESEYRPAQAVGGDFFQTLAMPDGGLLVGAIRNQAEHSFDPALMLATLNRRMMGRSGGHSATCLVAELGPGGEMRIANAGHMPPYRNGKEMDLEGSLPLGIADEAEYGVQIITLEPGDRLTFITDGVVEATNPAKEIFGFDRTRSISSQHAAAIVEQVQSFGQEDDITVLGIQFAAA